MLIGERLKEERNRLGYTQPVFAAIAKTTKKTQIDYEKNKAQPKADYLEALFKVGVDIQYIITGQHASAQLPANEVDLIHLFRAAPLAVKAAVLGALTAGRADSANNANNITVSGDHNRVAAGDYIKIK